MSRILVSLLQSFVLLNACLAVPWFPGLGGYRSFPEEVGVERRVGFPLRYARTGGPAPRWKFRPSTTVTLTSTRTITVGHTYADIRERPSFPPPCIAPDSLASLNSAGQNTFAVIAGIVIGSIVGASFLILATFLLLRWRLSAWMMRNRRGQLDPFVDAREQGGKERDTSIPSGNDKEMTEKWEGSPDTYGDDRSTPALLSRSGTIRPSNTTNDCDSGSPMSEPVVRSAGAGTDAIIRVFEGREQEEAILWLILQRMDPPPSFQVQQDGNGPDRSGAVGDGLPAYTHSQT